MSPEKSQYLLYQTVYTKWYQIVFRCLDDTWTVPSEVYEELEAFTCTMYGYIRESSVNNVQTRMLKKMVGEDNKLDKHPRSIFPVCHLVKIR